jgi:hypothetical protein
MPVKEKNELVNKILCGLAKSYQNLIADKKHKNEDLVILKNGRIVKVKAREIRL